MIERLCLTKPIKLFFILEEEDIKSTEDVLINGLISNFKPYYKKNTKVTSIKLRSLRLMKSKDKTFHCKKILKVIIFNNFVYFSKPNELLRFMRRYLKNNNISCSKIILDYYELFYGLPLYFEGNEMFISCNDKFKEHKDGMLQHIDPFSKIDVLKFVANPTQPILGTDFESLYEGSMFDSTDHEPIYS